MKQIILTYLVICFGIFANAQTKDTTQRKRKFSYEGSVQVGLVSGEASSSFAVQTIHGVRYKTWLASGGIGLDNYMYRTVPLFFELRKNILNKPGTPFLFGDIGSQLTWVKEDKSWWGSPLEYNGGLYYNLGAGYSFSLSQKYALMFSAAWSVKKVKESYLPYCDFCVPPGPSEIINDYTLKRLSLMAGFVF